MKITSKFLVTRGLVMKDFNSFLLADDVIVTGLLTARWSPELKDVRCDLDPVLIANNVR